jgi:Aminotransferase class I and II
VLAYCRLGDTVLIVGPTFGEYARAATLMGARVRFWTAAPEAGFTPHPEAVRQSLQALTPRLVFLCNPNNPTGIYLTVDMIAAWAEGFPQTLFIVDEAYLPFAAGAASVLSMPLANILQGDRGHSAASGVAPARHSGAGLHLFWPAGIHSHRHPTPAGERPAVSRVGKCMIESIPCHDHSTSVFPHGYPAGAFQGLEQPRNSRTPQG